MFQGKSPSKRRAVEAVWVGSLVLATAGIALGFNPVPTTPNDFFIPGTQPGGLTDNIVAADQCRFCHADYEESMAPYNRWSASMMGQAFRDPIFKAALTIANRDADNAGFACLRCHTPGGWVEGRALPADGSALVSSDFQGISCSICHRMVDPIYQPGNPADDQAILAAINPPALQNPHTGSYVLDPLDNRRGPFDLDADWVNTSSGFWPGFHEYRKSPFHTSSRLCGNCHDVSLEHFSKQPNGTYEINALNTPGPSDKLQIYPEQRTYTEWAQSMFAQGPIDLGGRFGGTKGPAVSTCQDCHMPGTLGEGCALEPPMRPKLPQHNFNGANSWVLRAVRSLYFDSETALSEQSVEESIARNVEMLQKAGDMELSKVGSNLNVRIINFSGHKLPTGYGEGRRMWINVRFLNSSNQLVTEHGGYDQLSATLDSASTKVYERTSGISPTTAGLTGKPAGESFHLVLNSVIVKDNRIPPMGFNNAAFDAAQAGSTPAGLFADGQYWDDTAFAIPSGATSAEVKVFFQTTTREYAEFFRDADADTVGDDDAAYALWVAFGKSQPVEMDIGTISLTCACDWNSSGALTVQDIFDFLTAYFTGTGDFNGSGTTTVQDIFDFLSCYFTGC